MIRSRSLRITGTSWGCPCQTPFSRLLNQILRPNRWVHLKPQPITTSGGLGKRAKKAHPPQLLWLKDRVRVSSCSTKSKGMEDWSCAECKMMRMVQLLSYVNLKPNKSEALSMRKLRHLTHLIHTRYSIASNRRRQSWLRLIRKGTTHQMSGGSHRAHLLIRSTRI